MIGKIRSLNTGLIEYLENNTNINPAKIPDKYYINQTLLFTLDDIEHAIINDSDGDIHLMFYSGVERVIKYEEEIRDRLLNKFKNI